MHGRPDDDSRLTPLLAALARMPAVLVACDYDGTLAPIVSDPSAASPLRESVVALRALAALADTHVAVVSGRALRDLAVLSRLPEEIHLIGSHGSEFDPGFVGQLPGEARTLLAEITAELSVLAHGLDGAQLEVKPASVAFHYRNADPDAAAATVEAIVKGPAQLAGVQIHHGKSVVELAVLPMSKGHAIDVLRQQLGVSAVLFVGDDTTDEAAFVTLRGPDIGIKVGPGDSAAPHRVDGPDDVARVLAHLAEARRAWVFGAASPPIERHSMLSDRRTVALLTPDARITWFCHPRPESSALFAELLGGPPAGYFAIRPTGTTPPLAQRYLGDTMTVQTRWATMTVTDYLAQVSDQPESAQRSDLIRVVEGRGTAVVELAPRLDFGRVSTALHVVDDGIEVVGATEQYLLVAPGLDWTIRQDGAHQTATATVELGPEPTVFELRCGTRHPASAPVAEETRRQQTNESWQRWASSLRRPTGIDDATAGDVTRSALLLRALSGETTGAILAAATTSLPEWLGGIRNWDYRYCWIRDAAMSADALVELGSTEEAIAYLGWLADRVAEAGEPERVRPLYALSGHPAGSEGSVEGLAGYAGSRPVRTGNAAELQVQADVFGPVAELALRLVGSGHRFDDGLLGLLDSMVVAVSHRWSQPDHGIWEVRRAPRHHVHSKVMCWVTVDRGMRVLEAMGRVVPSDWLTLRAAIAADVLAHGWKEEVGAFTAAYDGLDLDAAALVVGLSGLLAPDDPRFVATVHAVEAGLRHGPTVHRYRADDGLPGLEGGLHLCTGWLVEAYALVGRDHDARELFGRLCELCGPTGLLSEEFDPVSERALGNVPQAYSHLALVRAALRVPAIAR